MKNMHLVEEEEQEREEQRWKRLCLRERLGAASAGLKKLRRKSQEPPAKPPLDGAAGPFPTVGSKQQVVPAEEHEVPPAGGAFDGTPPTPAAECPDGEAAVDLRKHVVFPTAAGSLASHPSRKDTCLLRSVGLNGAQSQAFPDPATLPSRRRMACQPPEPPPHHQHHRALESAFSSVSHVIYRGGPESSLSPRKRPGEAAAAAATGVPSEIKAIQQTRRLLANARERTRVHTISAAFEALRKQVPCYSYGQKLSKLAILRIACNYILSLAKLADLDYSADHSNVSFSECVEQCTRTLQAEGRSKKRKE